MELMVVIGILGVLAGIVLVSVTAFLGEGKAEADDMNISSFRHGVLALLGGAQVDELDGNYTAVLTWNNAYDVIATSADGTEYHLTDYLMGDDGFPLSQAIDIAQDGTVTVSAP